MSYTALHSPHFHASLCYFNNRSHVYLSNRIIIPYYMVRIILDCFNKCQKSKLYWLGVSTICVYPAQLDHFIAIIFINTAKMILQFYLINL